MKSAFSLGIAVFLLGAASGVLGLRLATERVSPPPDSAEPATTVDRSIQQFSVTEQGLHFTARPTDTLARLTDDAKSVVGVRVFDPWTGDVQTAQSVDLIWTRQEKLYDQPEATSLAAYRTPAIEGLTVQETKELAIDGRPALKQLYTIQVDVPGPFGSTSRQPLPNQLRYVIQNGERFLIIRAPGTRQGFLDAVAKSLTFNAPTTVPGSPTNSVPVDSSQPDTGRPIDSAAPATTQGRTIDLETE